MKTFNEFLAETQSQSNLFEVKLEPGVRVLISGGSGVSSDATGVIVDPSKVKMKQTGGGLIPKDVSGAYKPADWKKEVAIKLDNSGELVLMYKERVNPFAYVLVYPEKDGDTSAWVVKHSPFKLPSVTWPAGGGEVVKKGLSLQDAIAFAKELKSRVAGTRILKYTSSSAKVPSKISESVQRHCLIYKADNNKWYLELGNKEGSGSKDSTTYGPFSNEDQATDALSNFSNPGGSDIDDSGKKKPPKSTRNIRLSYGGCFRPGRGSGLLLKNLRI